MDVFPIVCNTMKGGLKTSSSYWQRASQEVTNKINASEQKRMLRPGSFETVFRSMACIEIIATLAVVGLIAYFQSWASAWPLLLLMLASNLVCIFIVFKVFPSYRQKRFAAFVKRAPYVCEALVLKKVWIFGHRGKYHYLTIVARDGKQYNRCYVHPSLYGQVEEGEAIILVSLENSGSIDRIYPYHEIF